MPIENYYLHRGHAWAALEGDDRVRVQLNPSPRNPGPGGGIKLPEIGKLYFQDHICMALIRQGNKASFEAPVDGVIDAINPKVRAKPQSIMMIPTGRAGCFPS